MTSRALVLALLAVVLPAQAGAVPFPTRGGESGLLDVPDAHVVGVGNGLLGAELRLDLVNGQPFRVGPFPISTVAGLTDRLEAGLAMREWGQPGDAVPARMAFSAAAKFQLLRGEGWIPDLAVSTVFDRLNSSPLGGLRLVFSTAHDKPLRLAAFVGGEGALGGVGDSGVTWGGALAFAPRKTLETLVEASGGPRGKNFGGAVRWLVRPTFSVQVGLNWLPDDDGFRVSVGVAFATPPRPPKETKVQPEVVVPEEAEQAAATALAELEDRPRFRLRVPAYGPEALAERRHLQNAPWTPPVVAVAPRLQAPPRAGGPLGGDPLETQLLEQEKASSTRLKQLRASDNALATRELAAQGDARRMAERADQLASREQQLDARERRIQLRGAPTQQQRTLESQEAQLAAAERQLAASERGYVPALDAALGSERDAGGREQVERSERERVSALAGLEKVKAKQSDLRRQAVAAGDRLMAAMEARLAARGDRLDAFEKQLGARAERLDTWQRRLESRAQRLDLMEKRALDQQRGVEGERPAAAPPPVQAKDRAVFVVVVKSPTAVMKAPAAPLPGAASREAAHPGVAVEKSVAAATVVTFATPTSQISELDRESIDGVARLAAREGCEVLIWARAKDPSLMNEAVRRSEEIKGYVVNTASLSPKQVVTRITTRPGAQGVDVVVSALREGGKAAPAADGHPGAPAAAPAAARAVDSETSRRQIRDAVIAVQPSIERCISDQMVRRGLSQAEGTLKITVSPQGRVTGASSGGGQLGGPELEECLRAAAADWTFPPAEAEYVVDVPITVVGAGAKK